MTDIITNGVNAAVSPSSTSYLTGLHSTPPKGVEIDWSTRLRSVSWAGSSDATGVVMMVDQRHLPHSFAIVPHHSVSDVAISIKTMLVRGAPAIGAAGGFGMALAAFHSKATNVQEFLSDLTLAKEQLDASRPTAVNLSWATNRLLQLAQLLSSHSIPFSPSFRTRLLDEAQELADDDIRINKRLGDYGASILPVPSSPPTLNFLHHCNTGSLATVDYGTALGVIYSAAANKEIPIHVWVDETRPRLQGSRLTCYELGLNSIPHSLIVDSAAGLLMYQKKVDLIVFGADRVAANGDIANKIGTYKIAVVGSVNKIPVYGCVPTSTIDLNLLSGNQIPIETRDATEVTHPQDITAPSIAPQNVTVYNPAFDITPHQFLTAIITEEGICYPPFEESLKLAKEKAENRVKEEWNKRVYRYLHTD